MRYCPEYERAINALIPAAMTEAKEITKIKNRPSVKAKIKDHRHLMEGYWFHQIMNRMAREAGLRL